MFFILQVKKCIDDIFCDIKANVDLSAIPSNTGYKILRTFTDLITDFTHWPHYLKCSFQYNENYFNIFFLMLLLIPFPTGSINMLYVSYLSLLVCLLL